MRALAFTTALALTACGGSASSSSSMVFSDTPSQVLTGANGLEVRLFELVDQPVTRGVNVVRLEPATLEVEQLELTPWMPAMGHGSSVKPLVEADESGFVVSRLALTMPGTWEVRCRWSGARDDETTFTFDVR